MREFMSRIITNYCIIIIKIIYREELINKGFEEEFNKVPFFPFVFFFSLSLFYNNNVN